MKTASDPRHKARQKAVEELFAWGFQHSKVKGSSLTRQVIQHVPAIDAIIQKAAPLWPADQIAKADLAVMRLGIFELIYGKTAPEKVIIDEAVELAKEFGSQASGAFVNGVLGTVVHVYGQMSNGTE